MASLTAPLTIEHTAALAPASRRLIRRLAGRWWADESYLAGSAALALYLGHRSVRDLDLMSSTNRLTSNERRDLLADLLDLDPEVSVETARDGYLFVRTGAGVGLKLYYYPYPLVDPEDDLAGLAVASAVDLGLMKLGAIISRGARRDFVDLYLLCRRLPLEDLLERSGDKFGHVRDFPLQALKGLADLSAAESEPMPDVFSALSWEEVTAWLRGPVRALGRRRVGLSDGGSGKENA